MRFWRKEMFLGCSEIKTKPTAKSLHTCLGSLETSLLISTVLGQGAACANKLSASRLKAAVKGGCCWALPSAVAAWLQSMKTCTLNSPNVKISKYLFATTPKLLPKPLKMALLKAWNPSTDPGTTPVVEFSIAAALFLWKHKFSLNWIWQLKSKEI